MRASRIVMIAGGILAAGAFSDAAKADPYRWCADYGGNTGGTNCYFLTIEQCRATISGMSTATCRPNGFYDGVPVGGTQPAKRRARAVS